MRWELVVISAALFCLGCYQGQESDSVFSERQTGPPSRPEDRPDARARGAARQRMFSQLTRNTWTTDVFDGRHPDRTIFRFHANGSYRFDFLTDHASTPGEGTWNFLQDKDGTWWFIFDNGQRDPFRFDDDRTLTFLGHRLQPDEPLNQTRTWDQIAPVTVPESVQKVAEHLCADPWHRSNDLNLYGQPTLVKFYPDWTYRTTYRYGECHNQGTWYATTRPLIPGDRSAPIQADSPRSACDTRGPGPEHLDVEVLDGIGLLINRELFVPEGAETNKAVIWAMFGHSQDVRVSVHYDMPIRQGVPHRFDVEFKIAGVTMPELTLQRFSLTEHFDHSYRLPNHALGDVVEIAAMDLKRQVLKHGSVHKASLTATFHKSGTQFVYFNAMMYDRRQDWDTRCAYEMRVRPRNEEGQN